MWMYQRVTNTISLIMIIKLVHLDQCFIVYWGIFLLLNLLRWTDTSLLFNKSLFPANISMSDQCCFNVVDQRWNNVDSTLKMKQNPTLEFQRCTTLIQRQCPKLKQRRNDVTQRQSNVAQRWYNVDTTFFQHGVDLS